MFKIKSVILNAAECYTSFLLIPLNFSMNGSGGYHFCTRKDD